MSFQTIVTTNTAGVQHTFRETSQGLYLLDGIAFGQPLNGIKISPAKKSGPNGLTGFSVTRFVEFASSDPSVKRLPKLSVTTNFVVPTEANMGIIDDSVHGISSWLTADVLRDLSLGRQ